MIFSEESISQVFIGRFEEPENLEQPEKPVSTMKSYLLTQVLNGTITQRRGLYYEENDETCYFGDGSCQCICFGWMRGR